MNILANETFIKQVNDLDLHQVEFILRVWKDRITIWNPNIKSQDVIDDIWLNGTAIELGISEQPPTAGLPFDYDEWHYLFNAVSNQYPEKKDLIQKIERLANEAFPIVDQTDSKRIN